MLIASGSSSLVESSGSHLQHKQDLNWVLTKHLSKSYRKWFFQSVVSQPSNSVNKEGNSKIKQKLKLSLRDPHQ